ncbi:NAD(P)/FAD-dependent oxidoreductase [Bradyrhizobium mercantei]|uniref:NAD(P)/FAD-dependent oxidoreductase n=1 Tax=Bradyrhizobium mercantei TaxID=1904807 RepID=UPI0009780AD2|nr:FAD-dependent oxidoreductase [Bradyrhizobium mercantei]
MSPAPIVILGGGHAGAQLAASLREEGYDGSIAIVNGEGVAPYQRPPLSKGYIHGDIPAEALSLRAQSFFNTKRIDIVNQAAVSIDRALRNVRLTSGQALEYSHLILATGSRSRTLELPGSGLQGSHELRTLEDASRIRADLQSCRSALVIGAGFIGLEFAAAARKKNIEVNVIELADRPMARSLSPKMSDFFRDAHRDTGSQFHFGRRVNELRGWQGHVTEAVLDDGRAIAADIVLVGIGVVADDRLARDAGLVCEDGIVVDEALLTSDPRISAIGDCARHPNPFARATIRLESVQNAVDQAKCVARRLVGKPEPFHSLPWFWSDQGSLKLQIAGLVRGCDTFVSRGDPKSSAFSVFGFADGALRCVESVNRAGDHMAARRLLDAGCAISTEEAGDTAFDLKAAVRRAAVSA